MQNRRIIEPSRRVSQPCIFDAFAPPSPLTVTATTTLLDNIFFKNDLFQPLP